MTSSVAISTQPFEDMTKDAFSPRDVASASDTSNDDDCSDDERSEGDFVKIDVDAVMDKNVKAVVEAAIAKAEQDESGVAENTLEVEGKEVAVVGEPLVAHSVIESVEVPIAPSPITVSLSSLPPPPPPPPPLTPELGEWSQCSLDTFLLSHLPSTWSNSALSEQCAFQDERLWKRYFDARRLLQKVCMEDLECNKEDLTVSDIYKQDLQRAFQLEWRESVLGNLLHRHTYQRTAKVEKDSETGLVTDATIVSTIFSPYLLSRAIQLCCRYHHTDETDFWCSWHIQFVSLKDEEHDEDNIAYWKPHLYDMWELCSNGYLDMPTKEIDWMPIEDMDTSYLTPSMVRKIRKWLFGSSQSHLLFDDLTLMQYIFGSCGAVTNFDLFQTSTSIGHTWKATDAQATDMVDYGCVMAPEIEQATTNGTNWLEYQCRLITGSLRNTDRWYEPYDQKYYKGEWGEQALEHRYRKHGYFESDDHIRAHPHKVWERAQRGILFDSSTLQNQVMSVVGKF